MITVREVCFVESAVCLASELAFAEDTLIGLSGARLAAMDGLLTEEASNVGLQSAVWDNERPAKYSRLCDVINETTGKFWFGVIAFKIGVSMGTSFASEWLT